jgi:hypothetical protein
MFLFAKEKPHMSAFVVLCYYMLIVANFGLGISGINGYTESGKTTLGIIGGIISLLSMATLVILLNAYKFGGIINIITSGMFIVLAIIRYVVENIADNQLMISYIVVPCFNILFVLIVLLGSRKHNLL